MMSPPQRLCIAVCCALWLAGVARGDYDDTSTIGALREQLAHERGGKQAYEALLDKMEERRFHAEESARVAQQDARLASERLDEALKSLNLKVHENGVLQHNLRQITEQFNTASSKLAELAKSHDLIQAHVAANEPTYKRAIGDNEKLRRALLGAEAQLKFEKNKRWTASIYGSVRDSATRFAQAAQRKLHFAQKDYYERVSSTTGFTTHQPTILQFLSARWRNSPGQLGMLQEELYAVLHGLATSFSRCCVGVKDGSFPLVQLAGMRAYAWIIRSMSSGVGAVTANLARMLSSFGDQTRAVLSFVQLLSRESMVVLVYAVGALTVLIAFLITLLRQTRRPHNNPAEAMPGRDVGGVAVGEDVILQTGTDAEWSGDCPPGLPTPPIQSAIRRRNTAGTTAPTPQQMRYLRG